MSVCIFICGMKKIITSFPKVWLTCVLVDGCHAFWWSQYSAYPCFLHLPPFLNMKEHHCQFFPKRCRLKSQLMSNSAHRWKHSSSRWKSCVKCLWSRKRAGWAPRCAAEMHQQRRKEVIYTRRPQQDNSCVVQFQEENCCRILTRAEYQNSTPTEMCP